MKHEYIVQVDDTDRSLDFAFVGQIRRMCKQLVRCKDCKHARCIEQNDDWRECAYDNRVMYSDGYCSWAERKEE